MQNVDLMIIIKNLLIDYKRILKYLFISFIIGCVIAFGQAKKFKSKAEFISIQSNSSQDIGGLIQQISGMEGISIGQNKSLSIDVYPTILFSQDFLYDVLNSYISTSQNDSVLLKDYLLYKQPFSLLPTVYSFIFGLPSRLASTLHNNSVTSVPKNLKIFTLEDEKAINQLKDCISLKINKLTGVITIEVEVTNAVISVQLLNIILDRLNSKIAEFNIKRAQEELDLYRKNYDQAKTNLLELQQALFSFIDRNQNIVSQEFRTKQLNLQSQYDFALSVFNSLSIQVQQAQFKVKENTPIIQNITSPSVPIHVSKPQKAFDIAFLMLCGFLLYLLNNFKIIIKY